MVKFYGETLGLPIKDSDPGEGYKPGVDVIAFETGEVMVEIFDEAVHGGQLGDRQRIGGRVATAFGVDDLEDWVRCNDGKVTVLGPIRNADWGTYIYIVDVDGNPIQLYQEPAP